MLTTLRQRREALRLTQQEVATKAGTSQSYEIMGHSKVQTTMDRYQHVSVEVQRSVVDTLEERIFGSGG